MKMLFDHIDIVGGDKEELCRTLGISPPDRTDHFFTESLQDFYRHGDKQKIGCKYPILSSA